MSVWSSPGFGLVSSLGLDAETSWKTLIAGESGAGEITLFDHSEYPVHFACELKGFEPTDWVDHKSARRMDRFAQMILAAAHARPSRIRGSRSRPSRSAWAHRSPRASAVSARSRIATTCCAIAAPPG